MKFSGQGARGREAIRLLVASGCSGPAGIPSHREAADAENVWRRHLDGVRARLNGEVG